MNLRFLLASSLSLSLFLSWALYAQPPALLNNFTGVKQLRDYTPPAERAGESAYLPIEQIQQEKNLCVPTSVAMVLKYYNLPFSPREMKAWSMGREYDPSAPFNDFTITYFKDQIEGLKKHGIFWRRLTFSNDEDGFNTGLAILKRELDEKRPVIVNTTFFEGHSMVLIAYDNQKGTVTFRDPNILPPGLRELTYSQLKQAWNSSAVGNQNYRSVIVTAPPGRTIQSRAAKTKRARDVKTKSSGALKTHSTPR